MKRLEDLTVWVSFPGYPAAIGIHIERALRTVCRVVTVGSNEQQEPVESLSLREMKRPILPSEARTSFFPDIEQAAPKCGAKEPPDLFLWLEPPHGFSPADLDALSCPRACYFIDSHNNLQFQLKLAAEFDYVFIAQRACLGWFKAIHPRTFWLPFACDPGLHRNNTLRKFHDIAFTGEVLPGSRRQALLTNLQSHFPVHLDNCVLNDMARVLSESRIVFNNAADQDLSTNFFDALASASLLLSDMAKGSGQDELFVEGEDYALYHDLNIADVARFYLRNARIRERIAARGRKIV